MNEIIKNIEAAQLKETVPSFNVGDTVRVSAKIKEGNRERTGSIDWPVIVICVPSEKTMNQATDITTTISTIQFTISLKRLVSSSIYIRILSLCLPKNFVC